MAEFSHLFVETLVFGHSFNSPDTQDFLLRNFRATRYRDAMYMEMSSGEIWLFDYGIVVFWGVPEEQKRRFSNEIEPYVDAPLDKRERERLNFELSQPDNVVSRDVISLKGDEPLSRLAVSHALAQSAKLVSMETLAEELIETNRRIPRMLAEKGKVALGRKQLAMLRGELFSAKSDIILHFNLLDTPEFIWEYPELETQYLMMSRYLDILPRVSILSQKLETIHELLDMLSTEQNHKHSAFLEWIIIVLIAVDIVVYFAH